MNVASPRTVIPLNKMESSNARPLSVSVVIPTYKEAARLPQTLAEVLPYLETHFPAHELLVVDDRSPDGTDRIVHECSHRHPQVRLITQPGKIGKGAAVRRGCLEATGEYILFMDADHSTPIQELEEFMTVITQTKADAVAGVRTYQEDESRSRRIIGLLGQLLAHVVVFRKAVVDSQCGFKLFTRAAVSRLFPLARVDGGMLDVELFYLMHRQSLSCRFVPVAWNNKPGSRINILACIIRDPLDMLRIRLWDMLGIYQRPIPAGKQPWAIKP